MTQDVRFEQLKDWVHTLAAWENAALEPASADASFRRYFRARSATATAIVMDAPPDKEDVAPFIEVTRRLLKVGVAAPQLFAHDLNAGFLLLEDFGNTPLGDVLQANTAEAYYQQAIQTLLKLQSADPVGLPDYNAELLQQEMALMPEWLLKTHLQFAESGLPLRMIDETFTALTRAVLEQPTVFVHRDYHSRNLMVTDQGLGVIDHQDAVSGPLTYDLVSLLRDCYISWPERRVTGWVSACHQQLLAAGRLPLSCHLDDFTRWFDLTGLQRHIKVLGIFCRLHHRDGKSHYLHDLPLTLHYVLTVGARHAETAPLVDWMQHSRLAERLGTVGHSGEGLS